MGLSKTLKKHLFRDFYNRTSDLEVALRILLSNPVYQPSDEAGFNGQKGRKEIFRALLERFKFKHIIETGTFAGDTTGYMATTAGCPVFTCELIPLFHALARKRLAGIPSINLENMDSRAFLADLSQQKEFTSGCCFFYLDAHWGRDLPLKAEISIIASAFDRYIIMIDDFRVPEDPGYGYDRYGMFGKLDLAYLRPVIQQHELSIFFPALPAAEETGARCGSVLLAGGKTDTTRLDDLKCLKRYDKRRW